MLTLTENAQTAIKTLTSEAGLPEDGGVRIAMADGGSELQMALSPEPAAYLQCMLIALGMLLAGSFVFRKSQDRFILYL